MIFSRDYGFVFVHVPKTGGTSISKAIKSVMPENSYVSDSSASGRLAKAVDKAMRRKIYKKHETALDISDALDGQFENAFSFGVVRDPWDWLGSLYKFIKYSDNSPDSNKKWRHHLFPYVCDMDFQQFVEWVTDENGLNNLSSRKSSSFSGKKPVLQKDWLSDRNGNIIVDKVIKFENIAEEFSCVAERLNLRGCELPHVNKAQEGGHKDMYTTKSIDMVARYFSDDISEFGYDF